MAELPGKDFYIYRFTKLPENHEKIFKPKKGLNRIFIAKKNRKDVLNFKDIPKDIMEELKLLNTEINEQSQNSLNEYYIAIVEADIRDEFRELLKDYDLVRHDESIRLSSDPEKEDMTPVKTINMERFKRIAEKLTPHHSKRQAVEDESESDNEGKTEPIRQLTFSPEVERGRQINRTESGTPNIARSRSVSITPPKENTRGRLLNRTEPGGPRPRSLSITHTPQKGPINTKERSPTTETLTPVPAKKAKKDMSKAETAAAAAEEERQERKRIVDEAKRLKEEAEKKEKQKAATAEAERQERKRIVDEAKRLKEEAEKKEKQKAAEELRNKGAAAGSSAPMDLDPEPASDGSKFRASSNNIKQHFTFHENLIIPIMRDDFHKRFRKHYKSFSSHLLIPKF